MLGVYRLLTVLCWKRVSVIQRSVAENIQTITLEWPHRHSKNSKYSAHIVSFCCQTSDTTAMITRQVKVAQIWYFSFLFPPSHMSQILSAATETKQISNFHTFSLCSPKSDTYLMWKLWHPCKMCHRTVCCIWKKTKTNKTTHSCNWAVWMCHYGGM